MNAEIGKVSDPGVFTFEQVAAARATAGNSGRRLHQVLEEQSGLAAPDFLRRLAATFGYPSLDLAALDQLQPAFDQLSYAESAARDAVVLRGTDDGLILAFVDPFDLSLQAWADERLPLTTVRSVVHQAELVAWLARHEESMQAMTGALVASDGPAADGMRAEDLTLRSISEDTSPAVRLVHSTIYDALKAGASDIHMESSAGGLSIKYRIDGVLESIGAVEGVALAEQTLSRIKIMSELDIAERRVPQDGRFKVSIKGREIDFRVSIMPSIHSEDAVLRILDKQNLADSMRGLRLEYLGFADPTIRQLRRLAQEPHGMLLVTGPTGSGKTTTLYALITEINTGRDKVITIEDPVEYQLPGVLQIPVNAKKGLTFARGLRSILRHDPDKIMVGEIRDQETAQIAVQSALTGHLVFTTVHANNVFDVIGRFLHMGVDPYSFVAALNGVAAQRLIRVICPNCAREEIPDAQLIAESGLDLKQTRGFLWRRGAGCGQCRGSGYKGRKAVAEVLNMNDELREMIVERAPIRRIKETAQRNGLSTLRATALDLVRQGETDLQEINRATLIG